MRNKRIRNIALNILLVMLLQIVCGVLMPIKSLAEEEIVTIQCEDVNFYNGLVSELGKKVQSKDDANKTISMTKRDVESVTEIEISNYGKEEKITDITGIENFINLTSLTLKWNRISDISVIKGLTNLTSLHLCDNKISDISAIKELTNLTCLELDENQINDISAIKELTNLTCLELNENQISDISAIKGLTNLHKLHLFGNRISDISVIKGLTNLTYLNLGNNKISDISVLKGLTNLTSLDLIYNQISDISVIKGLTNLQILDLHGNKISDISAIKELTNLTSLSLGVNKISDISAIKGLTNLHTLRLSGNRISDISVLKGLTNLTYLNLSYNQISDISVLKELTNLTYLDLGYNQISDISAVKGLTNLTNLYLYNNQISDINAISGLTELGNWKVTNQTIKIKTGTKTIELPQIIKAAKDPNSKVYTDQDYTLTNCTLSSDGTKVIVDTDNNEEASIKINGGKADGTICTFVVDVTPPELEIKNSTTTPTNKNVTVTITANEEIQPVEGWTLSEGKKILTKEYTQNAEETVEIKDIAGNKTNVNVKVNNIDKIAPKIEIKSSEQSNGKVKVTITADEEIQIPTGWIAGETKNIIYKEYDANKEETVIIKDLAGNETEANIKINNIIRNNNNVTGDGSTNSSNKAQQDNTKISNKILPKTGAGKIEIIIMLLLIVFGTISYKKYRKCKDI